MSTTETQYSSAVVEQRTRRVVKDVRDEIRDRTQKIGLAKQKIASLRATQDGAWAENQVMIVLPAKVTAHELAIEALEVRVSQLESGACRAEIIFMIRETQERQDELAETQRAKKRMIQERKAEQKATYNTWCQGERKARYNSGKRAIDGRQRYFFRVSADFVQKHMHANLMKMPNNKGYIYRGVHYYGKLRPEMNRDGTPCPIILNESKWVDGVQHLLVHEYHPNRVDVYRKTGGRGKKQKRRLVSSTPRKIFDLSDVDAMV